MSGMDRQIERKHPFTKKVITYSVIGIVVVSVILVFAFSDKSLKLNVSSDKIEIDTVKNGLFLDYISVIGAVEPIRTIYIDATEGGQVNSILLDEGTMVKKGDLIMKLTNTNLLLDILNREANLAEQENLLRTNRLQMEQNKLSIKSQIIEVKYQLKKYERNFHSNELLFKDQHISREEFEVSKENYEFTRDRFELLLKTQQQDSLFRSLAINQLESSVGRMQDNIKLIRQKLNSLDVCAPYDGQLALIMPEIGESMSVGQRLAQINILDAYKMRVEVDEHYITRVTKGLKGEFEFADKVYALKLTKLFPEVKDGRFIVEMEFEKEVPPQIKIGQTARIRLELGESKQAVLIPRGAFYQNTGGQWIFVLDKNHNIAYRKNIKIGRQNPMFYEVLDGLEPGEMVIVSGYDTYGDAAKLILKN
ncbi:MAG TPA: HlyD family efflux transporter periplasmic adaptor subunit [Bacteroidales bacterium]|nr:HlyD family efflux transporter periplasmic adaptor subunit [Bacteroidales bacterium]